MKQGRSFAVSVALLCFSWAADAQHVKSAGGDAPGDAMIQAYLARASRRLDSAFDSSSGAADRWQKRRAEYQQQYLYMLGLWPMPEKTPLAATVTRSYRGDGFVVDMLHYQSRPHLYVTGNLYRPAAAGLARLPAVLYLCGHSSQGRDGNKTAYQSHGIWLARHGYVCLMLDTLQLGEIAGVHHGTYREGRWWWQSRGYTPAGVECLNGIRGIDYLVSRSDVDPQRIGVTGISGGGAATFWIAAADDRVRCAAPVSGMSDLEDYVAGRAIEGHCDCMFLYNAFQWPWTRIAALVAPRPLLFVNSNHDALFPMDGNQRIIERLKAFYLGFGKEYFVSDLVSTGGHAYRKDIRQAVYSFLNQHLKNDRSEVTDSESDLVVQEGSNRRIPIEPAKLRVFPNNSDIPRDQLNATIDQYFVPMASVAAPATGSFGPWQKKLKDELRRVTFSYFPARVPAAKLVRQVALGDFRLETEPSIEIRLESSEPLPGGAKPKRVLLVIRRAESRDAVARMLAAVRQPGDQVYLCAPRGVDTSRWTQASPPNGVERSLALLGRTADTCRIWDAIAAARYLHGKFSAEIPLYVAGEGGGAVLAAYAALWEPEIAGAVLWQPPASHMQPDAPPLLNVLRVCDVPDVLGMLAPRHLTIYSRDVKTWEKVKDVYRGAGAETQLQCRELSRPAK
jgi:dienelactone hydrolase